MLILQEKDASSYSDDNDMRIMWIINIYIIKMRKTNLNMQYIIKQHKISHTPTIDCRAKTCVL